MAPRPHSPWRWWAAAGVALVLVLLLAPWVYRVVVNLGWIDPDDVVGGDPYGKVLRRLLLIPLLIGVLGALRPWRDLTWEGLGLAGPGARPRLALQAWALTVAAIVLLLLVQGLLGWLVLAVDDPPGGVAYRFVKTLLAGALIAVIEEPIFRAWLPGRLGRRLGAPWAAFVSVALYALLHAFRATSLKGPQEVSTQGALDALGTWAATMFDPVVFGPACLGLALFGALLLALYRRTGTLWAPIGVHAAAVWVLFAYGGVTNRLPAPDWAGSKRLYDGPLGWALLLVALLLVVRSRRRDAPATPGTRGARTSLVVLLGLLAASLVAAPLAAEEPEAGAEREKALLEARRLASKAELLLRGAKADAAFADARRAFELRERLLGPEHPDTLASLALLGQVLSSLDRHAEGLAAAERVLAARERLHGPDAPETAVARAQLGGSLHVAGRSAEAKPHVERALAAEERVRGPDHVATMETREVLAVIHEALGEYADAHAQLVRVVAAAEAMKDPTRMRLGNALRALGALRMTSGDPQGALVAYERSVALMEAAPFKPIMALGRARVGLAHALLALGRYAEARPLLEGALAAFEKAFGPDHEYVGLALGHLGTLHLGLGDYAAAQSYCERDLARAERAGGPQHPIVIGCLTNLGHVLQIRGSTAEARALYARALALAEARYGRDHPEVALLCNNVAHLEEEAGRYAESRAAYERAVDIFRRRYGPEHPRLATALNNLAVLLERMGVHDEARALFERVVAIRRRALGADHPLLAKSIQNLATTTDDGERTSEARALYEEALAIYARAYGAEAEHPDLWYTLNNLGSLASRLGELDVAERHLTRALAIVERSLGEDHPSTSTVLVNLGALREAQGRRDAARRLFERALEAAERLDAEHPAAAERHAMLARFLVRVGDRAAAVEHAQRAMVVSEAALRRTFGGLDGAQRRALVATARSDLEIWLEVAPADQGAGYHEVLRAKGIATRATSAERRLLREGGPEGRARAEALAEAERALARLAAVTPPAGPALEAWRGDFARAAARRQRLALELARDFAPRRAEEERLDLGLEQVQAQLGEDTVLVDFLRTDERYHAWIVGPRGVPVRHDLGAAEALDEAVADVVTALSREPDAALGDDAEAAGRALGARLLAPWLARLPASVRRLVLCPDGALALLPFAALPLDLPASSAPTRLGDRYALVQVAMAQDLVPRERRAAGAGALVAGGVDYGSPPEGRAAVFEPLPWTKVEAETVAARLPEAALLLGAAADEAAVREGAAGRGVLHLATHGFVKEDAGRGLRRRGSAVALSGELERHVAAGRDPLLLAGLALAGANGGASGAEDDGILTAAEASHLDLSACRLVVLSACTTARGRAVSGEGVVGLVQGFQLAGAREVLGSLWPVDDEATQALMGAFYEALSAPGASPAAALRAAQARVRAEERWRAPWYWAAWVLWSGA